MPMQLAEACTSTKFINLHILWAAGEQEEEEEAEEEGGCWWRSGATRVAALFQPKTGK